MKRLVSRQDFVVGRGGEGEERGVADAFERDVAVDMGEEVDGDAAADAFFVAPEEDFFEGGEGVGLDGEVDFVDDVLGEHGAQVFEGEDGVFAGEADGIGDGAAVGWGEEAADAQAVVVEAFEVAAEVFGAFAESDDEDEAFEAETFAENGDEVAGGDAESGEEKPAEEDKDGEKGAADFLLESDDEDRHGEGAVGDLAGGITEDDADTGGFELP